MEGKKGGHVKSGTKRGKIDNGDQKLGCPPPIHFSHFSLVAVWLYYSIYTLDIIWCPATAEAWISHVPDGLLLVRRRRYSKPFVLAEDFGWKSMVPFARFAPKSEYTRHR